MSQSHLVETIAAVVRHTRSGATDVAAARAIVTGLSAAGYEVVRTRPCQGGDADDRAPADADTARQRSTRAAHVTGVTGGGGVRDQ
jgi:hypothetical protein